MASVEKINVEIRSKDMTGKDMKNLKSRFGSLTKVAAGLGLAFAAVKLKDFIGESIELFKVQEKAEARMLAGIKNLKNLGAGYEQTDAGVAQLNEDLKEYARSLQQTTTFGDEQIISAQAMLTTFQLSGEEIQTLTPSLLDMAASMEKTSGQTADLNDIAIAMGKAMSTGAGALGRYGIVLTDVQKEQFNLATGVEKTALLSQILADNFGGAATELRNTTAGALKAAANDWGDFQETVGQLLAPLLAEIAGFVSEMALTLQQGMADISWAWENDWGGIRSFVEEVWLWISDNIFPVVRALAELVIQVLGFIKAAWTNDWGFMKTIIITVWDLMKANIGTALEVIKGILNTATNILKGDWSAAWESMKNTLVSIWEGIENTITGIIDAIIGSIKALIGWVGDAISALAGLAGMGGGGGGGVGQYGKAIGPSPRAHGGPVTAGRSYMVGEQGPERFVPSVSGAIIPNNRLATGGGSNIIININGLISSKEVAMEYAGEIVRELQLSDKVV